MAGGLEAGIHILLDELPDRLTIGRRMMKPFTLEYSTSSALTQMSVYHCAKFSS